MPQHIVVTCIEHLISSPVGFKGVKVNFFPLSFYNVDEHQLQIWKYGVVEKDISWRK